MGLRNFLAVAFLIFGFTPCAFAGSKVVPHTAGLQLGAPLATTSGKVYLPDLGNHKLLVIDGHTEKTLAEIPLDAAPYGIANSMALSKDESLLALGIKSDTQASIVLIDTETDAITKELPVDYTDPESVAFGASDDLLFVSGATISAIDLSAGAIISNFGLPSEGTFEPSFYYPALLSSPDGTRLFVIEEGPITSATLTLFDVTTPQSAVYLASSGPFSGVCADFDLLPSGDPVAPCDMGAAYVYHREGAQLTQGNRLNIASWVEGTAIASDGSLSVIYNTFVPYFPPSVAEFAASGDVSATYDLKNPPGTKFSDALGGGIASLLVDAQRKEFVVVCGKFDDLAKGCILEVAGAGIQPPAPKVTFTLSKSAFPKSGGAVKATVTIDARSVLNVTTVKGVLRSGNQTLKIQFAGSQKRKYTAKIIVPANKKKRSVSWTLAATISGPEISSITKKLEISVGGA